MDYYVPTITDKFNAMVDSVNAIDVAIAGDKNIESLSTAVRNYQYLDVMVVEADIVADGRSLSGFTAAIAAGREFTGLVFPN